MQGIGIYNESTFATKKDTSLIKENITRILLTSIGERVNNYSFGSNLKSYLFNLDVIMQEEVDNEITRAVTRWEPRVDIVALRTSRLDENTFSIVLKCQIKETLETFDFDAILRM